MGEVVAPGQTMVAHGGRGGLGVVRPSQWQQARGKFVEQVRLQCGGIALTVRGVRDLAYATMLRILPAWVRQNPRKVSAGSASRVQLLLLMVAHAWWLRRRTGLWRTLTERQMRRGPLTSEQGLL